MSLLKIFVENGICPQIIRRGRDIILINLQEQAIRFIVSNSYIKGDENCIAEQFNLHTKILYFPTKFISKENIDYEGCCPPIHFFEVFDKGQKEVENMVHYINSKNNLKWNFQKELALHYNQKLEQLIVGMLTFLYESFSFQIQLQTSLQIQRKLYVHPFNAPVCSISSFVFSVYKVFYLNSIPIYSISKEYGSQHKSSSLIEYKFCSFMDYSFPEKKFLYAFSNPDGPKYFKECIPDLYSPVTSEAFFLMAVISMVIMIIVQ